MTKKFSIIHKIISPQAEPEPEPAPVLEWRVGVSGQEHNCGGAYIYLECRALGGCWGSAMAIGIELDDTFQFLQYNGTLERAIREARRN